MAVKDRLYGVSVVGTALRVQDRYTADAADQLAASIGFFAFLSLFPLIIVVLSIAGFVLRGDPAAQAELVATITAAVPGFSAILETEGSGVATAVDSVVENAGTIGAIGLVTLLVSGLRIINSAMVATTRVFRRPPPEGVKGIALRLGALALLGTMALAGAAAGASVGVDPLAVSTLLLSLLGTAVSFGLDLLVFLAAYRILSAGAGPPFRQLLPGALLGAAGWTALKVFGATYVAGQAADANALYGTLGGVIALLLLLYLVGRLYLYGAELSAHLAGIPTGPPIAPEAPGQDEEPDVTQDRAPQPLAARHGVAVRDSVTRTNATAPVAPPDPGPSAHSPAIGGDTRRRVAAADERRPRGGDVRDVRGALGLVAGLGALAIALKVAKPWKAD